MKLIQNQKNRLQVIKVKISSNRKSSQLKTNLLQNKKGQSVATKKEVH